MFDTMSFFFLFFRYAPLVPLFLLYRCFLITISIFSFPFSPSLSAHCPFPFDHIRVLDLWRPLILCPLKSHNETNCDFYTILIFFFPSVCLMHPPPKPVQYPLSPGPTQNFFLLNMMLKLNYCNLLPFPPNQLHLCRDQGFLQPAVILCLPPGRCNYGPKRFLSPSSKARRPCLSATYQHNPASR